MHEFFHRVLVVSGDAELRRSVTDLLRAGTQAVPIVMEAQTGGSAIERCQRERPDCVLLDDNLPDLETDAARQQIAELSFVAPVPVVLMTGHEERVAAWEALERGAADFVLKQSLTADTLHRTIRNAVRVAALEYRVRQQKAELERRSEASTGDAPESRGQSSKVRVAHPEDRSPEAPSTGGSSGSDPAERASPPSASSAATAQADAPAAVSTLDVARHIQAGLLPEGSPVIEGFEVAGLSVPAHETGGDYFDYLPLVGNQWGIAIGDSSGYGLGPALVMASTRAYLRVISKIESGPSAIVGRVNHFITQDLEEETFLTLFFAQLDVTQKTLTYASAGQQGYLLRDSGQIETLSSTGMPMGLHDDAVIPDSPPVQLGPGDLLLLPTDGVLKATAADGTQFGKQRMLDQVATNRQMPARMIVSLLHRACVDFASPAALDDDATIVVMKVEP